MESALAILVVLVNWNGNTTKWLPYLLSRGKPIIFQIYSCNKCRAGIATIMYIYDMDYWVKHYELKL